MEKSRPLTSSGVIERPNSAPVACPILSVSSEYDEFSNCIRHCSTLINNIFIRLTCTVFCIVLSVFI